MKNLSIYIHIPFCNSKCAYCDFVSFSDSKYLQQTYIGALLNEIEDMARLLRSSRNDRRMKVDTIFIGGGTPSSIYRGALKQIVDCVYDKFEVADNLELTVEANPESCDEEFIKEFVSVGANRLSLGLQSSQNNILKNIRKHTFVDFLKAVAIARKHKITNINADIMLGLPGQSIQDAINTIDELIKLDIPHISMYGLKIEEGTPLYSYGYETDEDYTSQMYKSAYERLKVSGYHRYEVSNFAKKGYECAHNKKYWNIDEYLGLGLAASSLINGTRKTNTANLTDYTNGNFNPVIEKSDFQAEKIMLGLRTSEGVELKYIDQTNKKLLTFIDNGMAFVENDRLKIADDYFYVMNSIILELI